jgi:dolichol kinase
MINLKKRTDKKRLPSQRNKSIQRRILHIAGALFVGYYFLPHSLPFNIPRTIVLYAIIPLVLAIELYRWNVHEHRLNGLLRDYEHSRPASFSYFAIASILLLLFFPQYISIPCILSTAFCDPIIGEFKQKNKRIIGYLLGFIISILFFILAWSSTKPEIMITAALIGAGSTMISEHKSSFYIDDDFLMQLVPAVLLLLFTFLLTTLSFPLPDQLISSLG